jgi:hypothetical protein
MDKTHIYAAFTTFQSSNVPKNTFDKLPNKEWTLYPVNVWTKHNFPSHFMIYFIHTKECYGQTTKPKMDPVTLWTKHRFPSHLLYTYQRMLWANYQTKNGNCTQQHYWQNTLKFRDKYFIHTKICYGQTTKQRMDFVPSNTCTIDKTH